jgi:hypothetical protein
MDRSEFIANKQRVSQWLGCRNRRNYGHQQTEKHKAEIAMVHVYLTFG